MYPQEQAIGHVCRWRIMRSLWLIVYDLQHLSSTFQMDSGENFKNLLSHEQLKRIDLTSIFKTILWQWIWSSKDSAHLTLHTWYTAEKVDLSVLSFDAGIA